MMERMCRVLWEMGDSTMSVITNKLIFDLIKQHYCPYATHEEFSLATSATRTKLTASPLRRGTLGRRLPCSMRERLPDYQVPGWSTG
jgi:hypothetical protein